MSGGITPIFGAIKDFESSKRASTSLSLNSTTWADVDTALDLVLAAAPGDVIEVEASGRIDNEAVEIYLDVATVVGGSPVNYFGTSGGAAERGIQAWCGFISVPANIAGGCQRTLVAGDISGGTVTLRLRYRTHIAGVKSLFATPDIPFVFMAKNLGQVGGWAALSGTSVLTPDTPPASPHADDYEFDATSSSLPSGWSWVNQGSSTYAEGSGVGQIRCASSAGAGADDLKALVRTIPAASGWVATMKLTIASTRQVGGAYPGVGVLLRDSASSKLTIFTVTPTGGGDIVVDHYTNPTTWLSRPGSTIVPWTTQTPLYLRLTKTTGATTYSLDYSSGGGVFFRTHTTIDVSSHLTPNQIGFGVNCRGSSLVGAGCYWYRVT